MGVGPSRVRLAGCKKVRLPLLLLVLQVLLLLEVLLLLVGVAATATGEPNTAATEAAAGGLMAAGQAVAGAACPCWAGWQAEGAGRVPGLRDTSSWPTYSIFSSCSSQAW